MKLVRYGKKGQEKPALIDAEGRLRDLSSIVPDLAGAYLGPKYLARIAKAKPEKLPLVRGKPRLGACVGKPGNIVAIGLNYTDHADEVGMPRPKEPILFNKAPSSLNGPHDDIVIPRGAKKVDWEVELAVVIGEAASYVGERQALSHVAGYCLANDVSEREFQLERGGNWLKGKSAPTFCPLGPWLVTPDEIGNVQALHLWLNVNGERMQTGDTKSMMFNVRTLISYISHFMALEPGDVILTGTPAGVGSGHKPPRFLQKGDTVSLGVPGLGEQAARVVAWSKT